jgi:long-chain fatty acid transport protein
MSDSKTGPRSGSSRSESLQPNQRTVETNLHFSDTCQAAIGQQLRIGEKWLWSAGFAYDSSPVSKANRLPSLPLDRQSRYGSGIQ